MGKRNNRKSKKKFKNGNILNDVLEEDDSEGKHVNQRNLRSPKVKPPTIYSDFTSNTVIKNQCLSNECEPQNCITVKKNKRRKQSKQKDNTERNPKIVLSNGMEDITLKKLDKTTIEDPCLSNANTFRNLDIAKFSPPRHASNINKSKSVYDYKDRNEDNVLNMSGARPKHKLNEISDQKVNQIGNGFNEFFIHDSESDDEYGSRNLQKKSDLLGVKPNHKWSSFSEKEYHKNNLDELFYKDFESYDEYMAMYGDEYTASSDFYEYSDVYNDLNISSDEYKSRNVQQNLNLEEKEVKESFFSSINEYENSKDSFSYIYQKWLPERKSTLEKLQSLYADVHEGQMKYIESQANLKDISLGARSAKLHSESQIFGLFASAMSLVVDAASGVSSFTQAYNTDLFQIKFQEIMDHDAEVTKDLYKIRSQCVAKYEGIEEVMKQFHLNTFNSTIYNISNTLKVDKYWEAMKNAYKRDDMANLMDEVGNFFKNACQLEVLEEVGNSIGTYVHDNPAALEGCKSTGKAMYGAINTWAPFYEKRGLRGIMDSEINVRLMVEDRVEAERLKNISKDYIQSKLESQIEDAIDLLESEMKEIIDTYVNLFKN